VFDWSGIYVGAHVGYGRGRTDVTDHTLFGNILLIPTQHFDTNGGLGGVQGGWNYQFGRFVLGTELDFSWANVKGDQTSTFLAGIGTINRSSKATWIGTGTTRLGYAWDRVLFYTKIGAAWAHFDYNDTASILGVQVSTRPRQRTAAAGQSAPASSGPSWAAGPRRWSTTTSTSDAAPSTSTRSPAWSRSTWTSTSASRRSSSASTIASAAWAPRREVLIAGRTSSWSPGRLGLCCFCTRAAGRQEDARTPAQGRGGAAAAERAATRHVTLTSVP
jgi:hypothetical protein